ncbi:MAG: tRNA (guanosine(37)-N1)-methyltransferase TrmD [Butyrivibrio sp.]|uniref:tRNA (guanosine(37)-N1)-methyltransferase TrmD n=1 Tax=Butyrivibrio sp. NC2002 TaxID=1410610 RepID=UPI000563B262|nr:tRNA (guanosine(37)-N1)-methyltransferase TrmD [Butyrivibrio sp. NC2002]MBE5861009.1 tRNA (guanosine(37)-N1)-methyltransferase TrmD [Butyrivibrio sp.]
MNFYIMTLFPEMVMETLNTSILKRAIDKGVIFAKAVNIRDYAGNKHNKVDDYTYGGGAGMLMQAQPIYDCYKAILEEIKERNPEAKPRVIYVTPQGSVFSQKVARELSNAEDLIFLCGHYEGIDERVLEEIVTDYISIGDYVLTGGELPAMVMIDAVSRLVPGVLNNEESAQTESFDDGLLEYPQYSRPEVWMDKKVPPVLLSGNHANVDVWRFQKSLERTKERRPELYDKYVEEHPEQFTGKALKKRSKVLDKINEDLK